MEATRAIQRALGGGPAPRPNGMPYAPPLHDAVIDGDFHVVDVEPAVQTPGSFVTRSHTGGAGTREYKLYVPATDQARGLPVIVMLHGCQQGPDDFAASTRMNALADEHGFIVVYPRQAANANNAKCWNWFEAKHQLRDSGEPSLIAGITRDVLAECEGDARRVYVAGLSAGGAMAAVMAVTYGELYAAAGVHSGLAYASAHDMPSAFAAMRGSRRAKGKTRDKRARAVPTIVFHGDSDSTVHPANGEELIAQASSAQGEAAVNQATHERVVERGDANGRAYTRTTYLDDKGNAVFEQWLVHGGAHAWSGGSTEGSFSDRQGPDASREMVRFFMQHKS
jgi:poly(hydroxyalkanoate) depolymerase family esterase